MASHLMIAFPLSPKHLGHDLAEAINRRLDRKQHGSSNGLKFSYYFSGSTIGVNNNV